MISTNLWVSTAPAAPLARCYRCNGEIPAKSEAMQGLLVVPIGYPDVDKLGLVFDGTRNPTRTSWFHLACAVDVFPEDTARSLAPTLLATHSDERAQALALAARRTAALRTRAPHAIEPARDPLGRPRVTVKVLGSASVSNTLSWMQLEGLAHDYAFCSSKREYVFDAPRSVASVAEVRDPSCPIVAGVVAALIDKPTVKSQRDKFAALYAVGITAPVLWLIPRSPTKRGSPGSSRASKTRSATRIPRRSGCGATASRGGSCTIPSANSLAAGPRFSSAPSS